MSNVIIVGCGRVGSQLAGMLSDAGHNVSIIDASARSFDNLARSFDGLTVQGVGYDEETLLAAGIEECDVLTAVTSNDNANLMAVEVASRLYHVQHVIARLYNPNHERAYMQLGIDYVCGTSLVAEEVFSKVLSGHGAHLAALGDYEVLRFSLDLSSEPHHEIRVSDIERNHDVRVVVFERADSLSSSIPTRDSILYHGDTVVLCVRKDLTDSISRFIQK